MSSFVSSVIQSFLIRHGFASQKSVEERSPRQNGSPSPHKRRRIAPDNSQASSNSKPDICNDPKSTDVIPLFINPVRKSYLYVEIILTKPKDDINGDTIIWKDPTTGETFAVDTRTGNSYPQETSLFNGHEQGIKRRTLRVSEWLKKGKDPCSIEDVTKENKIIPNWLQQALEVRGVFISFSVNLMHRA